MERLNRIAVRSDQLGPDFTLSPEYWISLRSTRTRAGAEDAVTLDAVAVIGNQGTTRIPSSALVLDTNNADRGLITLKSLGAEIKERVSHKKIVPEGSVIVSRLRPYLRQVAYVPKGISERLHVETILGSTEFYVLTAKDPSKSIAFLVPWLLSKDIQKVLDDATTGGHHPRFDEALLKRFTIPPSYLQRRDETSREIERLATCNLDTQLAVLALVNEIH